MAGKDQAALDDLMASLLGAYERADRQISDELRAIGEEETHTARRKRLRALRDEIQRLRAQLDTDAREWVTGALPLAYELGGTAAAVKLGDLGFEWTGAHEAALKTLASDTLSSLLSATEYMTRDAKRLVRAATKQAALDKLLLGRTAVGASRELRGELATNGINAVRYKNGAKHQIGDYADMVVRSVTAVAYNEGTLNEAERQDVKFAICNDGVECGLTKHSDPTKANGKVLPLKEARRYPISHPRCRRNWTPLPHVKSAKQARAVEESGEFAATPEQQRDEVQADRERVEKRVKQRARMRAKQRRLRKRAAKLGVRS